MNTKDWKIATEEGMTFAYRDPRKGEKTSWKLGDKPVVPVHVPHPVDFGEDTELDIWAFRLDYDEIEFAIQYYYDRWNFADDSCKEDKEIVDILYKERDQRKERMSARGSYGGGYSGTGGPITLTAGNSCGGNNSGGSIILNGGIGGSTK